MRGGEDTWRRYGQDHHEDIKRPSPIRRKPAPWSRMDRGKERGEGGKEEERYKSKGELMYGGKARRLGEVGFVRVKGEKGGKNKSRSFIGRMSRRQREDYIRWS